MGAGEGGSGAGKGEGLLGSSETAFISSPLPISRGKSLSVCPPPILGRRPRTGPRLRTRLLFRGGSPSPPQPASRQPL